MNIFYYDIIRGKNIGTESTHIHEVLNNIMNQGHNVLFYKSEEPIFKCGTNADSKLNFWGSLALKRPIIYTAELHIFLRAIFLLKKDHEKIDIIYFRHCLFNSGYWIARLLGIPAIKEVNGIVANEMQVTGAARGFTLEIIDRIEKANIGKADRIIVVTPKLKEILINQYKVPENRIVVIENGANTDMFKPMNIEAAKKVFNLNPEHSYVCFVGHFVAWQGLEYLIRCAPLVAAACPNVRFLLIGDGMLKSRLSELVKNLGISEMVIFTGKVAYEKVPIYINASICCVAPFIQMRNDRIGLSPLKLYEYMACGKPVVASNIIGVGDILQREKAGIAVTPEKPEELAHAIVILLKNEKLRDEMGRNGREYVIKNHSWMNVAEKITEIFRETI